VSREPIHGTADEVMRRPAEPAALFGGPALKTPVGERCWSCRTCLEIREIQRMLDRKIPVTVIGSMEPCLRTGVL